MYDLGHIVHDVVIASIQDSVQLNNLVVDVLDPLNQVIHVLIELLLELLGAQRLVDVGLQVQGLTIIILHWVIRLVGHRRAIVVLVVLGITLSGCLLAQLTATDLVLLAFLNVVVASAAGGLQEHIVDISHQPILVLVEHALIVFVVVIPLLGVSGVLLGKDKHKVRLLKPRIFIRVGHDILDFLKVFAPLINVVRARIVDTHLLRIFLVVQIFIGLKVHPRGPVEAQRYH
jgi:hypothetical protein